MKEVKWDSVDSKHNVYGRLGCVNLNCRMVETQTGKRRWYAHVWIGGCVSNVDLGPIRYSLAKAKEDCIRLARETMLNYWEGLRKELKNFELEM